MSTETQGTETQGTETQGTETQSTDAKHTETQHADAKRPDDRPIDGDDRLGASEVTSWLARMATSGDLAPLAEAPPAELCDLLHSLELLKNAASAAQARVTVLGEAKLRQQALDNGATPERADKGIAQQLALARRESPHAGSRHLGFARAVVTEMPHTHAALTAGLIGEWTATQIVKETSCLSRAHRTAVDAHLAGRIGTESHKKLVAAARARAYELDPYAFANRGRKAVTDRRVSVRPAPDVMAFVSGYVPVAQGVACFKALDEAAKAIKSGGDERTLDQIRADLFTQRLTGQATAEGVHIEVGMVMSDLALLGLEETPAQVEHYGPIPAPLARELLCPDAFRSEQEADSSSCDPVVWLRRLYAHPLTGVLTGQDDRRRRFSGPLRRFLVARDQVCRTPWCDAPVRHADHILAWVRRGRTDADNGEGLCEGCNYAKETAGWLHEQVRLPDGTHTVKITTPTGHTYYSQPPPVLPTLAPDGGGGTCHETSPGEDSAHDPAPGQDSAHDPALGQDSAHDPADEGRGPPPPARAWPGGVTTDPSPLERRVQLMLAA